MSYRKALKDVDKSMFWDINRTRSHNKLFNFIVGNRRSGKTYGSLKNGIDRYIKNGEKFIYLRRYKTELKRFASQVMAVVNQEGYDDHEISVKGKTLMIDGEAAGFAMPLSTAKVEKGANPTDVTTIIFDEFLIETGVYHYLQEEVSTFLDLYVSVSSYREVTVFFLANAISITNPYFLFFDLKLPSNGTIWKKKDGDILVEMVNDNKFIDYVQETRVGNFLLSSAPEYANYAILNEFYLDNEIFIESRPPKASPLFNLIYKDRTYGVWLSGDLIYVSEKFNPDLLITIATTNADHSPNTMLSKSRRRGSSFGMFCERFESGKMRFENINIKNICFDVMKKSLR